MTHCKRIAIGTGFAVIALLLYSFVQQEDARVLANGPDGNPQTSFPTITSPLQPETAVVPAGTRIQIRLEEAISPESNSSGDHFSACLYGSIWVDDKFLAPSRSTIVGQLTKIDSEAGKRGARLIIALQKLILYDNQYRLDAQPLTLEANADGNEGAAIGAGTGGGSNPEQALATNNLPVLYGPKSQFTFILSAPLELPVIRRLAAHMVGKNLNRRNSSRKQEAVKVKEIRDRGAKQAIFRGGTKYEN